MTELVATVDGAPVPVAEVDAREARLRAGPQAAALPTPGTSAGRQLRRWLAQLVVTERLVAIEAAIRGVSAAGAPDEAALLPDETARLEIGSVAAAVLADPLARAVFAHLTAAVDVSDDEVAGYHARNPLRFAAPVRNRYGWHAPGSTAPPLEQVRSLIADELRGAARRRAFRVWLDARRTALVWLAPGYEHPGDPRQPDSTHRHASVLTRMLTLALDVGGTKIAVGLVDRAGALVHTATRPTPADQDAEAVWAVVAALIAEALRFSGTVEAVGLASAGPIDLIAGTVSPVNIGSWRGYPLRERVAAAVPDVPVRLGGDGVCMALGEHRHGAGRGAQALLGMVVSTGVGGGLVLDGKPYHGRSGNAGHVGHVVVDHVHGPVCRCGGRGCVEAIASGPAMVRWAHANGWAGANARALAAAAAAGEPVALQAFDRGAAALAAMIASVAAVCDMDLVVIGGGVAKAGSVLFDPLRAALTDYAGLDFLAGLSVVPAGLGGDAGLVGAAVLATLAPGPDEHPTMADG